jgi:rubrerythrin
MTIEEAIKTAIEYETKVRDVYKNAVSGTVDETGKRIFGLLAKEEQYHLDFLNKRFLEWKMSGAVKIVKLQTTIPSQEKIEEGVWKLSDKMSTKDYSDEILMLRKALKVEIETSSFYEQMVEELEGDCKKMFANFLDIERGHRSLVQAEIDHLQGRGYWFDFPEFDLEVQ